MRRNTAGQRGAVGGFSTPCAQLFRTCTMPVIIGAWGIAVRTIPNTSCIIGMHTSNYLAMLHAYRKTRA